MDLDREVIRDIISEVSTPGGIGITMARSSVRAMLVKSCAAACTTAWSGSKPAIDLAKTVVEEKVRSLVLFVFPRPYSGFLMTTYIIIHDV